MTRVGREGQIRAQGADGVDGDLIHVDLGLLGRSSVRSGPRRAPLGHGDGQTEVIRRSREGIEALYIAPRHSILPEAKKSRSGPFLSFFPSVSGRPT